MKNISQILPLILTLILLSCSDNVSNPIVENTTGIATFNIIGSLDTNFYSNIVKVILPDSNSNYLTINTSSKNSKGIYTLLIRLLVDKQQITNFTLNSNNSITLSIRDGNETYKSIEGNVSINEWTKLKLKISFNAILENINNKDELIKIQNGKIEIDLK